MPPPVALIIATTIVLVAWTTQRRRGLEVPSGLFWPTLWYMVVSSRPVGVWMYTWGIPIPGGGGGAADGSFVDRSFFLALTIIGLMILIRRHFAWGTFIRQNVWLVALLLFMALSITWSEFGWVSFKRYIKVLGSVVMALVVLTNDRPFEAVLTVLRRCLYLHLPMSLICAKYYRDIGVAYDWSGSAQMWQGISTSKNVLGQVAVLGVLYFLWDLRRNWNSTSWRSLHMLYLLMSLLLLKGSPSAISMTSVSVCVIALLVFLRLQGLREHQHQIRPFVYSVFYALVSLIVLILVHSIVNFSEDSIFGAIISKFGRDVTLTDRTYIWSDVYTAVANRPLFGVGYGGFWIGREANIPWNSTMTWVLGQAHSGYVDTYLQLGLLGSLIFAGVLFTTLPNLVSAIDSDYDFGCFRIAVFITTVFVNITESTFLRGDHHLWFLMQLMIWRVPLADTYGELESDPIQSEAAVAVASSPEIVHTKFAG